MRQMLFLPILFFASQVAGQGSFSPTLFAPAGDFSSNAEGSLSWSIGEVAVQHQKTADGWLTEGLQQADSLATTDDTTTVLDPRYFTNVLTPGVQDKKNDVFDPVFDVEQKLSIQVAEAELTIFNRWGEVVFHEKSTAPKWDGLSPSKKPFPQATYYYELQVLTTTGERNTGRGTVTVLH